MRQTRSTHHGRVLDTLTRLRCQRCLVMLVVCLGWVALLQNTAGVMAANRAAEVQVRAKEQRLAEAKQQLVVLRQAKAFYRTDAGLVAASRPYGYGRPGEHRVMFDTPSPKPHHQSQGKQ
jgi:hypothetical protein